MIRDVYQRINKYIAKLYPKINQKKYESLKKKMIENIITKYEKLFALDAKIKTILDDHLIIIST